jgi:hypothetical protein
MQLTPPYGKEGKNTAEETISTTIQQKLKFSPQSKVFKQPTWF